MYQLAQAVARTKQIAVTLAAAVTQGEIAAYGDAVGFHLADGAIGERSTVVTDAEIVRVPGAAVAFVAGENVYDDALTGQVTNVVGARVIGYVYESQDNSGGVADILIVFHGGNE